jgi:hypothetical protein
MTPQEFTVLIGSITARIEGRRLDTALAAELEDVFPANGTTFDAVFTACRDGIAAGWMCSREAGGIRYGRVVKPGPATHGYSVDLVEMDNIVGPHHAHPNGEIDMVIPLTEGAVFDGHGAGWVVYEPGSAHRPTVSDGKALVLYMLPHGAIEFTKT